MKKKRVSADVGLLYNTKYSAASLGLWRPPVHPPYHWTCHRSGSLQCPAVPLIVRNATSASTCRSRAGISSTRRCSRAARCCSNARAPLGAQAPNAANPAWEGRRRRRLRSLTRQHVVVRHGGTRSSRRKVRRRRRAPAVDTGERYDLIVVGGGLSGLGAAAFFQKLRGGRVPGAGQPSDDRWRGEAKRVRRRRRPPDRSAGLERLRDAAAARMGRRLLEGARAPVRPGRVRVPGVGPGVTPLEMARDHYYFQLWADEFASHGFFFSEPNGSLRLVRDAFGHGLQRHAVVGEASADFSGGARTRRSTTGPTSRGGSTG